MLNEMQKRAEELEELENQEICCEMWLLEMTGAS